MTRIFLILLTVWLGFSILPAWELYKTLTEDHAYGHRATMYHHWLHTGVHGIKDSYWDEARGRWSFERDGRVCKL